MNTARTYILSFKQALALKLSDYAQLVKFRLSATVVFSSVMAFAIASYADISGVALSWLFLGGFLITGASNALNEVLEKDPDKLMNRTMNRPLATGRMAVAEAVLLAGVMGVAGIAILWIQFNAASALLGALSLLSYSFIYTPLKRLSPVAVLVGAIPGAMPVVIGWVAATGNFGQGAIALFTLQFLWQFPHFWSIAWVAEQDYKRAGFKMLPSKEGKGKFTAFQIVLYTLPIIPVSLLPVWWGWVNPVTGIVLALAGLYFMYRGIVLFRTCEDKDARKLMFASIAYLPVALITILIGRLVL